MRPFGLEPQRVLRLQKMHILVGQDTDSESTPYDAAMPWIVKLDKEEDFIGRWALEQPPSASPRPRWSASRGRRGRAARGRGVVRRRRGRRPGDELALLAPARQGDRHGVGAGRARRRRLARSRSPTTARRCGPRSSRNRSTTPKGRCCAREPRVPRARRRRADDGRAGRAQPDGARGAAAGARLRGARRLERRGRLRVAQPEARPAARPPASPTSRTSASSSSRARGRRPGRDRRAGAGGATLELGARRAPPAPGGARSPPSARSSCASRVAARPARPLEEAAERAARRHDRRATSIAR